MKRNSIIPACAAAVACVFAPTASHAATILAGGTDFNNPNWNTAGYGDVGYAFFDGRQSDRIQFSDSALDDGALNGGNIVLTPGAVGNASSPSANSVAIQNGAGGTTTVGALFNSGLSAGVFNNVFTLGFNAGSPSSARIGILVGASEITAGNPGDYPASIRLTQTSGTGTDVVTTTVTQRNTFQADWYFFDVTGITSGNVFTLAATPISGTSPDRFNPINGVAIGAIPEPTTFVVLLGGLGLLILRRRRA